MPIHRSLQLKADLAEFIQTIRSEMKEEKRAARAMVRRERCKRKQAIEARNCSHQLRLELLEFMKCIRLDITDEKKRAKVAEAKADQHFKSELKEFTDSLRAELAAERVASRTEYKKQMKVESVRSVVLSITGCESNDRNPYPDSVEYNLSSKSFDVEFSGQTFGRGDFILKYGSQIGLTFRIYFRQTQKDNFKFIGDTSDTKLLQERRVPVGIAAEPVELSRWGFRVGTPMTEVQEVPRIHSGIGHCKRDVFAHAGLPPSSNISLGIHFDYM